jgi:hypothetical protein
MLECDLSRFSTDGNGGRVVWIVVFTKEETPRLTMIGNAESMGTWQREFQNHEAYLRR